MAISSNLLQRLHDAIIESTATAGQEAMVVVNPDGSNVGSSTNESAADDSASNFTVSSSRVTPIALLVDETATDSVAEGRVGAPRMSADRKQITASSYLDDAAFTPAGANSYVGVIGGMCDETTPDSVDEGDAGAVRITATRFMKVSQGDLISGEDQTVNCIKVEQRFSYTRVTADTQIKASAGFVHAIHITPTTATPTAGLISIYDNTAESGTIIYSEWVFATTPGHTIMVNATAGTGIYVGYDATLANVSCTISWR